LVGPIDREWKAHMLDFSMWCLILVARHVSCHFGGQTLSLFGKHVPIQRFAVAAPGVGAGGMGAAGVAAGTVGAGGVGAGGVDVGVPAGMPAGAPSHAAIESNAQVRATEF